MANRITIPKLSASVSPLQLPQIDIDRNPYATVEAAAAKLGKAFETRDVLLQQREEADAQTWAGAEEADTLNFVSSEVARRKGAGEIGPGFSASFDLELEKRMQAAEARATSKRQRELLRQKHARIRPYALQIAMQAEAGTNQERRESGAADALDRLAQLAYDDPANIGAYRDESQQLYDQLSADEQAEFDARRERINDAYFQGLIRDNPKLALETLRSRAGAADELGISEERRQELEALAERAYEAEQSAAEAERQENAFKASLESKGHAIRFKDDPSTAWLGFDPVIKAYEVDPKLGRWLESEVDAHVRKIVEQSGDQLKVGRWLAAGEVARLNDLPSALDSHATAVIGEDEGAAPDVVRRRSAAMARIAGRVADVTRRRIVAGVHSKDPAARAETGRLMRELNRFEVPGALEWAPPEVRRFGTDFDALTTHGGLTDKDAIKRIANANTLTPAQEEARGRYFDDTVDDEALSSVLKDALGVEVRDLLYRPEEDAVTEWREPYRDDGSVKMVPLKSSEAVYPEPRSDAALLGSNSDSEKLTSGNRTKLADDEERLGDYNSGDVGKTVDEAVAASSWWDRAAGRAGMKVAGKGRYVWTRYGWVDLQHVISAATATNDPLFNLLLGIVTEAGQTLWPRYWSSAWRKEDLLSNWIGARALARQRLFGGNLGEAVAFVLREYGPVSQADAARHIKSGGTTEPWPSEVKPVDRKHVD